jgi:hypothetical protein
MGIWEDRLSTEVVDALYIAPETEVRPWYLQDREGGPVASGDTSGGMDNQEWIITYDDPDFTLTPQTTGSPIAADITVAGVEQVTFCFDQNARPTIAYVKGGSGFLYWYDSDGAAFVTTEYVGIVSLMLSLDDKREMENNVNDMLFWYTMEFSPGIHYLYHRKQRERFLTPYEMVQDCFPYFNGAGMHKGLRGKIVLSTTPA